MSHAITSSTPWPTHQPLTAATMGLVMRDSGPPGDPAQAVLETFASDHRPDGLPLGRMGFQVGAGGERVAGSGDHGDAQRRVVTEVAPDVTQQLVAFDIDGVLDLRAVKGDVGNLTALVIEHLCSHDRTFRSG
jgi:hypothetical protein